MCALLTFGAGLTLGLYSLDKNEYVRQNEEYKLLLDAQKYINKQLKVYNEMLKQHNNYLMSVYNAHNSRG